jgi:LPS sulfotransferase NodH
MRSTYFGQTSQDSAVPVNSQSALRLEDCLRLMLFIHLPRTALVSQFTSTVVTMARRTSMEMIIFILMLMLVRNYYYI